MKFIKKVLWYNMFDLEMKGKDIRLAKRGTSTVLVATLLLFVIDYCLWNIDFIVESVSDETFDTMHLLGSTFIGKVVGLLSFGMFYLFVFIMMGRKQFFEQTLQEYKAMSLTEKHTIAQKGKWIIVIPFVVALLILMYLLFFVLD